MYIYHKDNDYKAFSSLRALSDYTGINYDTLTYHFSRNKSKSYAKDFTIVKTDVISSKRKYLQ